MFGKQSRSLQEIFRFRRQNKSNGRNDGNRQDDRIAPPVGPTTPSKLAAGGMPDAGTSQIAEAEPISSAVGLQSDLSASSVQDPSTPLIEYAPPVAATSLLACEATSGQEELAITIPPEELWDKAYDDIKSDESKLFELYEAILSRELGSSDGVGRKTTEHRRRSHMDRLLSAGLDKTAKLAHVEKSIGDAINIVLSVKEAVGSALVAVPIAAAALTGVCVALQASFPSVFDC